MIVLQLLILSPLHAADTPSKSAEISSAHPLPQDWTLNAQLSDEFDSEVISLDTWEEDPNSWGPWSWDQNNVWQKDGALHLQMVYEPHRRKDQQLYYKSGIVRSNAQMTYGYVEARIKGCSLFPGACPAFWLNSGQLDEGAIRYCEVDIVEMLQGSSNPKDPKQMHFNLHTRIENGDGKVVWLRPKQSPELCAHEKVVAFDPRDDFHRYACRITPKRITWFVDDEQVVEAENRYWHLPMKLILSLGLRPPYLKYVGGDRVAVPETSQPDGFPTEMTVDYVRVWTAP